MSEADLLAVATTEAELAVYADILNEGGRVPFHAVAGADAAVVLRLIELGLLVHNLADASLSAVNPRAVGERIAAELRSTGTRLFTRAEEVPTLLTEFAEAYDRAPRPTDHLGEVRHISDFEEIRHRIIQIEAECREEILAAQPGHRPPQHMDAAADRARDVLERGCAMHVLYGREARVDPATAEYVATVTGWGMKLRVLREPFSRLMIFDRRVAVVPAAPENSSAAFIEDPVVVTFLVSVFQRDWERAEPGRPHGVDDPAVTPAHEHVGRLLAQGLTQRAVASRLGLSERTVAGHIARLRELHDAQTLFQLGWLMRGE